MQLSRQQLIRLVLLTLVWGLNWPVMKFGLADFPPLTFRAMSIWLGVPVLGLALVLMKVPFFVPRERYRELFWLAFTNMFVWHVLIIVSIKHLSSGRAAILGYTMPIFSALIGAWFFGDRLKARSWVGVGAAALGVGLLLWYELTNMTGSPLAVVGTLIGAATWALGTRKLSRTTMPVATLTISFWMTVMTAVVLSGLSLLFEMPQWKAPSSATWFSILYNAVLIFGFAHAVWYVLARSLPPVASSLSVMMIPILGVFSGAIALGEVLHWQDWAAVGLMVVAMASVLVPTRAVAK
ncbi:DMT family transporter [Polaromonas sp. SM01]|uniref:DMT family transporter n=1 Tax=Polaromonas sp. SM01 TaxID=3085630 RepID=UPI002981D0FF|nr:DMT family transporter [Polaromonas sp. SM01]MDW5441377.1 DMT family transporter [Polaromonas sp. SM01]